MNLQRVVMHLFPEAIPNEDFMLRNDGATPILHPGADGLFRFPLLPLAEDETEEVEGIHYRMAIDYNRLTFGKDYDIVERGPYMAEWNLSEPKPTEAELLAAWDAIKDLLPEPEPPTDAERIAALEADSVNTMLAVTESFETQQQHKASGSRKPPIPCWLSRKPMKPSSSSKIR